MNDGSKPPQEATMILAKAAKAVVGEGWRNKTEGGLAGRRLRAEDRKGGTEQGWTEWPNFSVGSA